MAEENKEKLDLVATVILNLVDEQVGSAGQYTKKIQVVQWKKDGQNTGRPKLEKRVVHTESGRGKAQGLELDELDMVLENIEQIRSALQ